MRAAQNGSAGTGKLNHSNVGCGNRSNKTTATYYARAVRNFGPPNKQSTTLTKLSFVFLACPERSRRVSFVVCAFLCDNRQRFLEEK